MGQLVLVVVAAAWAAVLIPPLLRSRLENRPNSSVADFRNQLSSLQKMPSRSVTVRSMGRSLTSSSSPLSRPVAGARPVLRSGVTTLNGSVPRPQGHGTPRPRPVAADDAGPRPRRHGDRPVERRSTRVSVPREEPPVRDGVKRRRANVVFVLLLVGGSSLFLAATMQIESLYYVFGGAFFVLCAYVYVLGRRRQRQLSMTTQPAQHTPAPARRRTTTTAHRRRTVRPVDSHQERWSHAV